MPRFRTILAGLGVFLLMAGCGRKKAAGDAAPVSRQFPGPADVPTMIVSQEEKMAWISEHYWDRFLDASEEWACDSVLVNGVPEDQLEESFGVWVSLIENLCPLPQAARAASILFDKAEAFDAARPGTNVFEKIRFLTSKYFYDPNSPGRNEDIYLPFVEKLSKSPSLPDSLRAATAWQARLCSLNRVGTQAADFSFRDRNGRSRTLYGIRADRTLLVFSNPGCPECTRMIGELSAPEISSGIADGSLAIVTVYIDEDIENWKKKSGEYPSSWICGYDPSGIIRRDLLYNVRAIPSMYLLDKEKTVLLKDAPAEKVLKELVR